MTHIGRMSALTSAGSSRIDFCPIRYAFRRPGAISRRIVHTEMPNCSATCLMGTSFAMFSS
jgi:hypothetical protein